MESIKLFFETPLFMISDFVVKTWYIFVLAAVILAILAITIICIVVKKKKNKQVAIKISEIKAQEKRAALEQSSVKAEKVKEQPIATEKAEQSEEQTKEVKEQPVAEEKPEAKKVQQKKTAPAKKPVKRLNGKWQIVHKNDKEYIAELLASNGEVMLSSETYSTEEGAKNGIATIIKGVENGNFVIYKDKGGDYYYKLKSATNKLLCVGAIYSTKEGCASAVESVKRIAADSPIQNQVVKGSEYIEYVPEKASYSATKSAKGKWKIEKVDNGYSAKLYANNGQLMIATEVVAQKQTAEKAVASVKKNSLEGNFIIDKDKSGKFYYKLRNAQKSVICIGETYDSLDLCVKAIESVRKFAEISEITL